MLNKASYGPTGYTVDTVCSALRITTQKNSDKYFTSGIDAAFLASRVRSEQMTRIQKVVVLGSKERPVEKHLAAVGRQRDELNIL